MARIVTVYHDALSDIGQCVVRVTSAVASNTAWSRCCRANEFDNDNGTLRLDCAQINDGVGLVPWLYDLVIANGRMRAWTPARQPVWRPALHSGDYIITRSWY
jgi:hypothetical protein